MCHFNPFSMINTIYKAMAQPWAPKWPQLMQTFSWNMSRIHLFFPFQLKPTVYYRYIDDIFMIWSHGMDKIKHIFDNASNTHPNITFIYEASTALHFLASK